MKRMQKASQGFTLVELVMVIVIIGILAAVAMPKFFDLTKEAEQAAVDGLAASINTGMTVNFAARKASNKTKGAAIAACSVADANKVIETAIDGAKYTISEETAASGGNAAICLLKNITNTNASAKYTLITVD